MSGNTGIGDNHRIVGDIALGTGHGFETYTDCDGTLPCTTPDRIASENSFENCAAIGFATGFGIEGIHNTLDHVTAITMGAGTDIRLEMVDPAGGYAASAYVTAALCSGGDSGVQTTDQSDWSVASSNVFGAVATYVPNDAHVTASTTIDPQLAGCLVYLPPSSPMRGAGPNGTAIGADIRAMQDGRPYWRSDGTYAGCGAVVPGVNDDPTTSCIGVHTRLDVGTNGCAPP